MRYFGLAVAVLGVISCSGGSGGGKTACTFSIECQRGQVCDPAAKVCTDVPCSMDKECAATFANTFCWDNQGLCTAMECGIMGVPGCAVGEECNGFLCLSIEAVCVSNSQCAQPAEKCLNGQCVPVAFCQANEHCTSGVCDIETKNCVQIQEDVVVPDLEGEDIPVDLGCVPDETTQLDDFLCAECSSDADCGCGMGQCIELANGQFCSIPCLDAPDCPSGYSCVGDFCKPMGVQCKGCMKPPGCTEGIEVCDFKTGECMPSSPWCATCAFDYECGFGNRCWLASDGSAFCAPECDPDNFSCPLASGCEIRMDNVMICVSNVAPCCYGKLCDTCTCETPTPICLEDGGCAQCVTSADCPPGKPICDSDSHLCVIQCIDPNPVYWMDPETGKEYCLECATSKDCPEGMYCGTFKNKPETYHKCYFEE